MERNLDRYVPQPNEIKEGKLRKIYTHVPLDADEEQSIAIFREYTASNSIPVPDWVTGESRYDLKFMDSMKKDPKKAVEMMNNYLNWLTTMPVPENEVINLLRRGLIYVSGRSLQYNPVIIVNVRKIIDSGIDLEGLLRLNYFVLNWVIENMLVPGKVESWIIVQDIKDVGVTQVPAGMLKTMSERLSIYYSLRLSKCFTINVPLTVNALWSVVKHFIDEDTRKKIFIKRKGWEKLLAEIIAPNNLEEKYGGSLPNKETYYPFN